MLISRLLANRQVSLFFSILAVAVCLRGPITGVGPLLQEIQSYLGLNNTAAGILATLPLLAFAGFSLFAPKLALRFGTENTLLAALGLLIIGILWRSAGGSWAVYLGTALLSMAIAVGNVLIPGLVKQHYPLQVGLITALYALTMNLGGAAGSAVSVPLSEEWQWGWRGALAVWAIPGMLALLIWVTQVVAVKSMPSAVQADHAQHPLAKISLWRNPLAWMVTLFMGLQSLMFYTLLSWLPHILAEEGISATQAGAMLGMMQVVVLPITLITPILASKLRHQQWLGVVCGMILVLSMVVFVAHWSAWYFTAVLWLGVGMGGAFSLSMMLFGLRSDSITEAAALSGMAQAVGYLLAACGPVLFGLLHDWTHSWIYPLVLLLLVSVLIAVTGYFAGRDRKLAFYR